MKKRLLSALLALCLMVSLMPTAWASGGTADPPVSGNCGSGGARWLFTESTGGLLIFGSGPMDDYTDLTGVPWAAHREKIKTVDINSSVESIGSNAFAGCVNLSDITISDSVKKIGTDAFTGCSGLKSINYSGSDEDWNKISGLENIPEDVAIKTSDQGSAMSGTCGPGVTWMLTEDTTDPNNPKMTLTIVGKGPIVIEDGRAPWAANRDKITDIIISDDVTAIGAGAFAGCPNLETVLIPDSVTTIEGGAFAGIANGTIVRYTGDEKQWNDIGGTGKSDIVSAGITPVYNYRPIVLTFTRGEATEGTSFQRTTIKGSIFLLPKQADQDFKDAKFEAPVYMPPGSGTPKEKSFRGWLVTIDGKEVVYPEGYPIQVDSNTTFTAWWDEDSTGTNEITFRHKFNDDPQLFENPPLPAVTYKVSAKDQVLMVGNPSKDGYDFLGWTTLQDRNTLLPNIIVPGGRGGTLIYIANWKGQSFDVMVQEEDGTEFGVTKYVVSPAEQQLIVKVPVADGMTWEIESVTPASNNVSFEDATPDSPGEATIIIPADSLGDILVQGKFYPNTYDITWDANGGAWDDGEKTKTSADAYEYDAEDDKPLNNLPPDPAPTRRGYELNGWVSSDESKPVDSKNENGVITVTVPAGTFGDLTLLADWNLKKYTVTWDADGGTWGKNPDGSEISTKTSEYTIESESISQAAPTKEGYTFLGWKGTAQKESDNSDLPLTSSEENKDEVLLDTKVMKLENITLTAIWAKNYTIKFDANGGTGEMADIPTWEGNEHTLWDCGFTAPEGKTFKTWKVKVNDRELDFEIAAPDSDPDNPTMIRNTYTVKDSDKDAEGDTITFVPVWEAIKWTITLVPNTGNENAQNTTVELSQGEGYELPDPAALGDGFKAPAGKAFDYWEIEGLQRKFSIGYKIPVVTQDYTIIAHWKDILYTVTFDKGDPAATGEMAPVGGLTYGTSYTLPECGYTYPDPVPDPDNPDAPLTKYVFLAWAVDGVEYAPGASITIDSDKTVTAVWEDEKNLDTYVLKFLPGSKNAAGTMEDLTFRVRKNSASGVMAPLPAECGFTFADMTFAGWKVGGVEYAPGGTVSLTAPETTATAVWHGKIVYQDGGGVTKPDHYVYTDGAYPAPLPIEGTPVKPGSIFEKWTCDNDQVVIFNNSLIDLPEGFSGTLTLTGHWVEDEGKYLVIFDPNGGTGEMSPVAVDKATEEGAVTEYELPACAFTPPEGMEFDGWSVEGTKYPAGGKIILTASKTTVKAEWKKKDVDPDAKDCVVTYDPGEGTGEAIVEEGHKVGEWLKLPECTFTAPEGMEFDAWQKGEQKAAPGEEVYLDSAAVTITALWKEKEPEPDDPTKPWTITFDANGGTGAMDPVTVPKAEGGTTYTLPACGFTAPEGKTFQAWKFDGKEYAPGAVITITGDTTITAVWKDAEVKPPKPTSWKITYNLNGGYMTGSGPTSYNLSDQAQTLNVPVPYKSGFTFLGWTYSGVSKPTKSVVIRANMTGDLTVVANWQMNPGAGGGNNTSQGYYISVSATAGGEIIIPWEYANQGAVVSVQARPQPGYEVGGVTVVNSQGFEVGDLKDLGGGNYSFTMPGYRVNVSATFKLQSAAAGPITRPVMNYEDVRLGDWFYDSVEYVYTRGMMSGVSATQFGPYGQATRGAIWTALAAHAGFDINGGATWYERGQYWAVNRGITDGESPSGTITREQLVTMLWRYKGSPVVFGGDLWQFTDGYAVSSYAMDAMRWAVSTGLIGGANGRLSPQASTTRAEAAAILARFCQS